MERKFTDANYEVEVLGSELPVLIDFYADWCGPCKMMAPIVEELANEYEGKMVIGKCNVDENPELARKYGVMSIPTFAWIKNGAFMESKVGAMSKNELESIIKQVMA